VRFIENCRITRELVRYKLDLLGVQEVRWDKGGVERVETYTVFYVNGIDNHHLGTNIFAHKGIISVVERVEFVRDRMLYIILKVR
jgi:hypothetical protein